MRQIALALALLAACKSSEKSSSPPTTPTTPTTPTPAAAPVADDSAATDKAGAPAPAEEPANTLKAGAPVRKAWGEGGPGEVVWTVDGGAVTLRAEPGKPEGVLIAEFQGKKQHVTNFACDTGAGSEAAFALTPEGKVLFRAAVGPIGKRPAGASVFLLEWKPDKGTVFVANSWQGKPDAEPPPWAKI